MAPNLTKIKKACNAMKPMGIEEDRVKAVLKKLLKTYDNNWKFIEESKYRVLIDAILDEPDDEFTEMNKKEGKRESKRVAMSRGKKKAPELVVEEDDEEMDDEEEIPLKRRLRPKRERGCDHNGSPVSKKGREQDNASPSLGTPLLKKAKKEDKVDLFAGSPVLEKSREVIPKPEELEEDEAYGMTDLPPLKRYLRRTGGKGSVVDYVTRSRSDVKEVVQKTLHYSDAENCSSSVVKMEKSVVCVVEQNEVTKVTSNDKIATYVPPSAVEGSGENKVVAPAVTLELASSTSGEAKICLNFAPADGETTNLHLPSVEDLRIAMEEKCLKTYKIKNPGFSVIGFMEDMCSCYIDLAKNSTKKTEADSHLVKAGNESGATDISMGLVVVPDCGISTDGWREISSREDITGGKENLEIPWVNEINDEVPSRFHYIPQSIVFRDAAVNVSVSSISDEQCCFSCTGNCLDSSAMPCKCTIPYTVDGVLKDDFLEERISEARDVRKHVLEFCQECPLEKAKNEEVLEPCEGHIQRKAIKECWYKCGCTKRCGNRVVQRGIHYKLEVFYTPNGKGWGLRTLERIPKGAYVCEYIGEVLTFLELYQRSLKETLTSAVILDAHWGSEEGLEDNKALCLDGTRFGNISRFLNHRCLDPNLIEIPVQIETPVQHYYRLAFFTTRDVEANEELTWDYGIDFDDEDSLIKPFDCLCGSRHCRNMKRSKKAKKLY